MQCERCDRATNILGNCEECMNDPMVCNVCNEDYIETPSGYCCPNGHGRMILKKKADPAPWKSDTKLGMKYVLEEIKDLCKVDPNCVGPIRKLLDELETA